MTEYSDDYCAVMVLRVYHVFDDMMVCCVVFHSGMGTSGTRCSPQWSIWVGGTVRVNGGRGVALCNIVGYDDNSDGVE